MSEVATDGCLAATREAHCYRRPGILPARLLACYGRGNYALRALGGLFAETMSYAIRRHYGADIEAHWYIGRYVLPGNIEKVILKPKTLPSAHKRVHPDVCSRVVS